MTTSYSKIKTSFAALILAVLGGGVAQASSHATAYLPTAQNLAADVWVKSGATLSYCSLAQASQASISSAPCTLVSQTATDELIAVNYRGQNRLLMIRPDLSAVSCQLQRRGSGTTSSASLSCEEFDSTRNPGVIGKSADAKVISVQGVDGTKTCFSINDRVICQATITPPSTVAVATNPQGAEVAVWKFIGAYATRCEINDNGSALRCMSVQKGNSFRNGLAFENGIRVVLVGDTAKGASVCVVASQQPAHCNEVTEPRYTNDRMPIKLPTIKQEALLMWQTTQVSNAAERRTHRASSLVLSRMVRAALSGDVSAQLKNQQLPNFTKLLPGEDDDCLVTNTCQNGNPWDPDGPSSSSWWLSYFTNSSLVDFGTPRQDCISACNTETASLTTMCAGLAGSFAVGCGAGAAWTGPGAGAAAAECFGLGVIACAIGVAGQHVWCRSRCPR